MDLDQRNKELCKLYESGKTVPEISKSSGLSPAQLSRIFRAAGVMRKKYELDKDYFERNKGKTTREISDETGLPIKRVTHLKRVAYGKKLSRGKTDFTDYDPSVNPNLINDRDWLHDQYVVQRFGAPTIARKLATKCSAVYRALKKHGIQRRNVKTMMEEKRKWPPKSWLTEHYIDKGWSIQRCAKAQDSGWDSIYAALKHYGLPIRSASEQHVGELNSFYGKEHEESVRESCREIGLRFGPEYWSTGDVESKIESVKQRNADIWSDPEKRAVASRVISELCKQGSCNSKSVPFARRDGAMIYMKSSWECLVAKILDQTDLIDRWEYEHKSIEYMDGDIVRNFVVDFWVLWKDGLETYIECKNPHLMQNEKEQVKIDALKNFCERHRHKYIIICDKSTIKKMAVGYKSLVQWKNETRYRVHRKYLDEPELFIEIMLHEIVDRICPWKPLEYNDDELLKDVTRLQKENLASYHKSGGIRSTAPNSGGMPGRALMTHFHPHFWDVTSGGQEALPRAFNDRSIIYHCLNISYSENESLSTERLLRELNFHYAQYGRTSHFAPGFARTIIRYLNMSGSRIFDPCCGWGGRMLGAWLEGCEYSGYDLSPNTYRGLVRIAEFVGYDPKIMNMSCTEADWPECDLILTSPPFYDVEKYVGGNQPWMEYTSREEWISRFVQPFIDRVDATCALYLDHKTKDDFESIRPFDEIVEIQNRRHARQKHGTELLCMYR